MGNGVTAVQLGREQLSLEPEMQELKDTTGYWCEVGKLFYLFHICFLICKMGTRIEIGVVVRIIKHLAYTKHPVNTMNIK